MVVDDQSVQKGNMFITVPKAGYDLVFAGSNCRVHEDPACPNMSVLLYGKTNEDEDYWVGTHTKPGGHPNPAP